MASWDDDWKLFLAHARCGGILAGCLFCLATKAEAEENSLWRRELCGLLGVSFNMTKHQR